MNDQTAEMATIFVRSPVRPLQLPPCCVRLFAHAYSEARPGDLIHGEAMDATQISGNRTSARSPSGCRAADCASYPPYAVSAARVSAGSALTPSSRTTRLGVIGVIGAWSNLRALVVLLIKIPIGLARGIRGIIACPIPYPSSWPLAWTTSATVWLPVRPRPAKVPAAFYRVERSAYDLAAAPGRWPGFLPAAPVGFAGVRGGTAAGGSDRQAARVVGRTSAPPTWSSTADGAGVGLVQVSRGQRYGDPG